MIPLKVSLELNIALELLAPLRHTTLERTLRVRGFIDMGSPGLETTIVLDASLWIFLLVFRFVRFGAELEIAICATNRTMCRNCGSCAGRVIEDRVPIRVFAVGGVSSTGVYYEGGGHLSVERLVGDGGGRPPTIERLIGDGGIGTGDVSMSRP
jgi:hypothetical protein